MRFKRFLILRTVFCFVVPVLTPRTNESAQVMMFAQICLRLVSFFGDTCPNEKEPENDDFY